MKKILLVLAMLLTVGVGCYAENNESSNVSNLEAYEFEKSVNIGSLVRYLNLSDDQVDAFKDVHKVFAESMRIASVMRGDERKNMVTNSIMYELKNLKFILTERQYRKYLIVLNSTLENRGLRNEVVD